jgi:hypothetical protein
VQGIEQMFLINKNGSTFVEISQKIAYDMTFAYGKACCYAEQASPLALNFLRIRKASKWCFMASGISTYLLCNVLPAQFSNHCANSAVFLFENAFSLYIFPPLIFAVLISVQINPTNKNTRLFTTVPLLTVLAIPNANQP